MITTPFKFLDSYTKEDKDIFFGREQEIEELYQKVFESKILLVYGISGTGKSSLIDCGLANKFNDSDWLPINIRRGKDINESLITALNKNALTSFKEIPASAGMTIKNEVIPEGAKRISGISLTKALKSIYLDHFKPIYLIFDQFEEVFIFGSKEERKEFIKNVKKVIESEVQCKFLFVIREEYLAGITEFEREITDFFSNRIRIEKMNRQNAKQVIEEPCKVYDIEVEKGFAEQLIEKLSPESTEVELTYLQVYLDKVFRTAHSNLSSRRSEAIEVSPYNKEGDSSLTLGMTAKNAGITFSIDILNQLGSVGDLLGTFLEEQIHELDNPDAGLAILKSFVSIKGTKKQITEEEVQEYANTLGQQIETEELKKLLNKFVNLRILRDKDESGRYELRHDSLAAKIYEKISIVEKEMMEVRQFVENAYNTYEKRGILLSREDLKYLNKYKDNLFLPGLLDDFVLKSKNYEKSKSKVVKRITLIAALVFILLIALILKSYFQKYQKIFNQSEAIGISNTIFNDKLKFQHLKENYGDLDNLSLYTQQSIFRAFYKLIENDNFLLKSLIEFKNVNSSVQFADFTNNGDYLYACLADTSLKIWNINGNEILSLNSFQNNVIDIQISENNAYLAIVESDSTVTVWNISGEKLFTFKTAFNKRNIRDILRFKSDNKYLISLDPENEAVIYDLKGNRFQLLNNQVSVVNSITISSDDKFIATAATNGEVNLWYYNSIKEKYFIYDKLKCHKDTIWSVNFSKNNKYFLTASADSSSYIFNFNGEFVNADDYFDYYNYKRLSKIAYAEFSQSEKEIILTRYDVQNYKLNPEYSWYLDNKIEQIDLNKKNCKTSNVFGKINRYSYIFNTSLVGNLFTNITFSPDDQYMAIVLNVGSDTWLLHLNSHFKIIEFKGDNPVFSPNGKYLLTLKENKIFLYPVEIKLMYQIYDEHVREKEVL
ncbi:MAG: hypothetical protein KAT68_19440 [Bacteroidales bacterium]|nr:hypothetical protein [Bacteroidales bacterium]